MRCPYPQFVLCRFRAYRQDGQSVQRVTGALRVEIEAACGDHLVTPPFDARRRRHPESVDIENPAADAVLGDFGHRRHPLVAHGIEPLRGLRKAPFLFIDGDDEARLLQRGGNRRPFRAAARRRDQDAHRPTQQRFESLDALPRELVMRLLGAERLALRVERGGVTGEEHLKVREPALRVCGSGSNDREDALRQTAGERGNQRRGTRTGKATHPHALAGQRQAFDERARRGKVLKPVEQKVEGHQRVRVATPSSAAASNNAKTRSIQLASSRRAPEKRSAARRSMLRIATRSAPPNAAMARDVVAGGRSEERRVGKECRSRWSPHHVKKKKKENNIKLDDVIKKTKARQKNKK